MEQVFADRLSRIERQCAKLPDPTENPQDPLSERKRALAALLRNAMLGNKTGGNSGRKALRVRAGAMAKARRKASCVEKDETTRLTWSLALRREFGWDVLKCPSGGARTVVAAVQDANEIKRFLTHRHRYPDPGRLRAEARLGRQRFSRSRRGRIAVGWRCLGGSESGEFSLLVGVYLAQAALAGLRLTRA